MSWRIWSEQITFLSLHHKNPPSLFTMLKSAGRFFIYEIHQAILITSWAFNYTEKPRIRLFWNDECRQILRSIGYYRLSGYLYPFLEIPKTNHIYKRGSTLNGALSLYEFDREFRLLVFNQIERIEISFCFFTLILWLLFKAIWYSSGYYLYKWRKGDFFHI